MFLVSKPLFSTPFTVFVLASEGGGGECKFLERWGGDVRANFQQEINENGLETVVFENFQELMIVETSEIEFTNSFNSFQIQIEKVKSYD